MLALGYPQQPEKSYLLSNGAAVGFEGTGLLVIDTNGIKGPNVVGKDYHLLYYNSAEARVSPQQVLHWSESIIVNSCPSDLTSGDGFTCGIRIMRGDYGEDY